MYIANVLQPLIDACQWILEFWHDLIDPNDTLDGSWGIAIILLTFTVRIAILPLTFKGVKSMQRLQTLQPAIKQIQERYKDDKQRMNQEIMAFYQREKVNPLGSCFPLLLQIPFFISLFYLLRSDEFTADIADNRGFLAIENLAASVSDPVLLGVLIVLYVGTQLAASAVTAISADPMQRRIMFALPFVFVIFIINFEAGLIVYWITTNVWTIGQQLLVRKLYPKPEPLDPRDAVPEEKPPKPARGKPSTAVAATDGKSATRAKQEPPADGDFVLVTGQEPKLVEGRYDDNYWLQSKGIPVQVGDRPPQPQLRFTIRKGVALQWPDAGAQGAATTVDDGVIAWDPYAGANTYLVRIVEVEREGRTTSYHEVATKPVVGATNFPLKQLQVLPSADAKKEYEVSVVAFDEAGNLLSQSERFGGGSFVLSDGKQLVREPERMPGSEHFDPKELQQVHDNNRRIEAAAVLLKDGLDKDAERLLGKIQGKVDPGKKAAVTGYLMAVRGRCAEANRLFAQAQAAAGAGCVPDHYRAGCKK